MVSRMLFTGERVVPDAMHNNLDTYQQHLVRYVWALDKVSGKRVVDAACGTGYGSNLLATVADGVLGVDIDPETIKYGIQNYPRVSFMRVDLDKPPPELQADVIVSFETIEHLKDPVKFLTWCKHRAPEMVGSIPINCPNEYHKHVYTGEQIRKLVNSIFVSTTFFYQFEMDISRREKGEGMVLFHAKR